MKENEFLRGNERAVLLLHAYTGTNRDVYMLAKQLNRAGYTVYAPTFKGHGTEDVRDILRYTPYSWLEEARGFVCQLNEQGYQRVAALGLSMGGVMATRLAIEERVCAAGVFCSPIVRQNESLDSLLPHFLEYAEKHLPSSITPEEQACVEIKGQENLNELSAFVSDTSQQIGSIHVPFYIAQGEQDTYICAEDAILLKEALQYETFVDFHWFEESGHVITAGVQRVEFQQTVQYFLDQLVWWG